MDAWETYEALVEELKVGKIKLNFTETKIKYTEFMKDYFEEENCKLAKDITEKARVL